jgi:tRNA threonylcarbamoyladenosine biosynthesis protein TsaB
VKVLALDTSTDACTVSLVGEPGPAYEITIPVRTGHAGSLLPLVDRLFSLSPHKKEEVGLIAVGIGPGSFTGIRIGIATAKGLALALGIPLAGVCTLDALARGALPSPLPVMPVIDARKSEIFCALYSPDGAALTKPMNIRPERLADMITAPTLFMGNAVPLYRDALSSALGGNYVEAPEDLWYPRASVIGRMAAEQRDSGSLAPAQPLYVRASDAEIKVKK